MASSSTSPLALPRVQRPLATPSIKQAGLTTTRSSRIPTPQPSTITLPPIRPTVTPVPSGVRPSLPPVTSTSVPAPTPLPTPFSPPTTLPRLSLPPVAPPASGAVSAQVAPSATGAVSAPSPLSKPAPPRPLVSAPATPAEARAKSAPLSPPSGEAPTAKGSRKPRQPRQRRAAPSPHSLEPSVGPTTAIPEGFPNITPPRQLPPLPPPPPFQVDQGPYPQIISRPSTPRSPSTPASPSTPSSSSSMNGRAWADGRISPVTGEYISPEGTEPPYLPQDEQDIIDEYEDEPWHVAGTVSWDRGQLIIGSPEDLFEMFRNISSWREFQSRLPRQPHVQINDAVILLNALNETGSFQVYAVPDLYHQVDTEIHLV